MADPNIPDDKYQDIDFSVLSSNIPKTITKIKDIKIFHDAILYTEKTPPPFSHTSINILLESGLEIGFNIYVDFEVFHKEINRFVVLLFNKLNKAIDFSPPKHRAFHVNKPINEEFNKLLIDIYWAIADVMKGVKREQFIYAKHKYDTLLQPQIKQLLTWYIRDINDWNVSLGSHGKRIKEFVDPYIYNQYLSTYSASSIQDLPKTLINAKCFVTDIGSRLAISLGHNFPSTVDNKIIDYLNFGIENERL